MWFFPLMEVSCLESSSSFFKSSSNSESVLALIGSNSRRFAAFETSGGSRSIEQLSKLPDPSAMKIREPMQREVTFLAQGCRREKC